VPDTFNSWAGAKEQRGPGTEYPTLGTRNLGVEDLLNAARALRAQREGEDAFDSEQAHQFLFEAARDNGSLDTELLQAHRQRVGHNADVDITRLRNEANASDTYSIPIAGQRYNVYDEDYNVYNAVNRDPKTQYFFEQNPLVLANPEQLHLDIVNHLQQLPPGERSSASYLLSDLSSSGFSPLLNTEGRASGRIADIINIAGTGNSQVPSFQNVYSNVRESLNEVTPFINAATNDVSKYNLAKDNLEDTLKQIKIARGLKDKDVSYGGYVPNTEPPEPRRGEYYVGRGRPTAEDLRYEGGYTRRSRTPRKTVDATQLSFTAGVVPKDLEGATQLLAQNKPFTSRVDIEDRTKALHKMLITLDNISNSEPALQQVGTDLALNQIIDKFGEHNTLALLDKDRANRLQAEDAERYALSAKLDAEDAERNVVNLLQSQSRSPRNVPILDGIQPAIEGLPEQMDQIIAGAYSKEQSQALNYLDEALAKYPEVKNLYENKSSLSDVSRPAAVGKDTAKRYEQYIDTQQRISLPEERTELYNKIMREKGVEPSVLANIESAYTSGNTSKQREAIQTLSNLGYDELGTMGTLAASSRKPIIGGERYVETGNIAADPEAEPLLDYIRNRANTVNRIISRINPSLLEQRYPDFKDKSVLDQFEYTFDPQTKQVQQALPGGTNTYGIKLSRDINNSFELLPRLSGEAEIPINVLKFVKDNPVVGDYSTSINFKTKTPQENYSFSPKELPKEISDIFQQEATRNAVAGVRPGTLVTNSPISSHDYITSKRALKNLDSATVRKAEDFIGSPYNKRGAAYTRAGFGPTTIDKNQYLYVTPEGTALSLQGGRPEAALTGKVKFNAQNEAFVTQSRVPLTSKAYYAIDPVTIAAMGATELLQNIKPKHVAGGLLGDAAINFALGESPTSAAASAVIGPIESVNTSVLERLGPKGQFVDTRSNTVLNNGRYTNQGIAYKEGKPVLVQRGSVAGEATVMDQAKSALGYAKNVNAARVNRVTNEAKYILNNLLGGKLPYGR
jgi:hypothetical protein